MQNQISHAELVQKLSKRGEDIIAVVSWLRCPETPPRAWGRQRQVVSRSFQNTTGSVLARFQGFDDQLQS